jgi:diguanylate cyclase (GGDEF)-like protein/putative nucleotidyltransferase with HDIG domain/PAS domain S-box-containing protein
VNHDKEGCFVRHCVIEKLLTNNKRFTPEHPEYRRVYLLNIIYLLFIGMMFAFAVLNSLVWSWIGFVLDAAAALLGLLAFVYFHKTDKIETSSYMIIGLVFLTLAGTILAKGNQHYLLIWTCVFPQVAVFLLKRKSAVIIVGAYLVLLLAFLFFCYVDWSTTSVVFTSQSIANIAGTVFSLIMLSFYYDLSRRDAINDAVSKNETLESLNVELLESKEQLRLILDSTAEAIFGLDVEGRCTFCNASCLELLGFKSENELIGYDIHELIHSKRRDGSPLPRHECDIIRTCLEGTPTHAEDEVFWRGEASFEVEYHSYPQYKDGALFGAVVTFTDNTLKKMQAEQIQYYSSHDSLTGLLNRSCFETVLRRTDVRQNLPLSVIMADLNGLKLTNDVFGHGAGDELLVKSARVLKKVCREDDIVARQGGDEFIILLPRTPNEAAQTIVRRIQDMLAKEKTDVIRCSVSLGCDTKLEPSQSIDITIKNAENNMYQDKSLNRNRVDADMINAVIMTLYSKLPQEEQHSLNVSELCRTIGEALGLPAAEIVLLRRAGLLHDIGKISVDSESSAEQSDLSGQEDYHGRQHPAIGFRILNLFDSTVNIAEAVYSHHEHWDGSGYPRGLKDNEIPLMARIIAVVGRYDHLRNAMGESAEARKNIIAVLREEAGTHFDPKMTELLIDVIKRQDI